MTPRAALDTLLAGLVDFAGLFPPAALSMADAVRAYAGYRAGPHARALGKFVVPAARLGELAAQADAFRAEGAWPLTVIGGGTDVEAIIQFDAAHGSHLRVESIESVATSIDDVEALRVAAARLAALTTPFFAYVEVRPADDLDAQIAAVKAAGLRAKIRTGGVTPDAFPSVAQLERFIRACAVHEVPFKATAGLHHTLRGEYRLTYETGSARGTMFGFLNVFLAALFVRQGLGVADTCALLEERDARAFGFDRGGVSWRGHSVPAEAIPKARERLATSFGSCSFSEPVEELSAMGLL